jgi:hypothetical protein
MLLPPVQLDHEDLDQLDEIYHTHRPVNVNHPNDPRNGTVDADGVVNNSDPSGLLANSNSGELFHRAPVTSSSSLSLTDVNSGSSSPTLAERRWVISDPAGDLQSCSIEIRTGRINFVEWPLVSYESTSIDSPTEGDIGALFRVWYKSSVYSLRVNVRLRPSALLTSTSPMSANLFLVDASTGDVVADGLAWSSDDATSSTARPSAVFSSSGKLSFTADILSFFPTATSFVRPRRAFERKFRLRVDVVSVPSSTMPLPAQTLWRFDSPLLIVKSRKRSPSGSTDGRETSGEEEEEEEE